MASPSIDRQDRRIARDVTVWAALNQPVGGGALGTAFDLLGTFKTVEFDFKRDFVNTEASNDASTAKRATKWGEGSAKCAGMSTGSASKYATLFAQGGHAILRFTESTTGDSYELLCTCETFSKSIGEGITMDTVTFGQSGIPYLNGTPMVLE